MASGTPEGRIRIIAENLARAALQEMRRDVQGAGTAAGGTSMGFDKMVLANNRLVTSTAGARRGLNLMENGLRTLAFQAAGIPGPVGKVVSGFGLLGAGSLVVTGVVAGVGAIALGYQFLTSETTKATTAMDAFAKGLSKAAGPAEQFQALVLDIQKAEAGLTTGVRGIILGGLTSAGQGSLVAAFLDSQRAKLDQSTFAGGVAALGAQVVEHDKLIEALQREGDLIGTTAEQAARLRAEWLKLTSTETADYVAAALRIERRKEENRVLLIQRDLLDEIGRISKEVSEFGAFNAPDLAALKLPDIFADESARQASLQVGEIEKQGGEFAFGLDQDFFTQAGADVQNAIEDGAKNLEKSGKPVGVIMAQSFLSAVQIAQQGGAAGALGAGGAILSGLSELKGLGGLGPFGIVTSAFATAISVFDRGQERRQREQMEELRRIRENTGRRGEPRNISLTVLLNGREVSAEILGVVMYGIRRAERTNAVPILPPS